MLATVGRLVGLYRIQVGFTKERTLGSFSCFGSILFPLQIWPREICIYNIHVRTYV